MQKVRKFVRQVPASHARYHLRMDSGSVHDERS